MNDVEQLIKDNKRLIDLEVVRYSTNLPQIAVQLEAYKLAREAARTYDPKSGYKFSTHLVNNLKKLSRLSTKYGNTVRAPENVQFDLNRVQRLEKDLEHTLGRPPTMEEISHHSGMSMKHVVRTYQAKKITMGLSSMLETPDVFSSENDEWIQFVYHDLPDKDKLIFEYLTGFGGKPKLDNTSIAKKLNITQSVLNSRIANIKRLLGKGLK